MFSRKPRQRISGYLPMLDQVFMYQVVTKAGIFSWIFVLRFLFRMLLRSTGRVAISSGDFKFLFTSWQGPMILIIGLFSLYIYVALDLYTKIILSGKLLRGQKDSVLQNLKEGFISLKKFLNPGGIGIIIYIAFIAPLVGVGFSISATNGLYIPSFITGVINHSRIYAPIYYAFMAAFAVFGISHLFILHGILLDDKTVKEAGRQSREIMKAHWKDYFLKTVLYFTKLGLLTVLVTFLVIVIPLTIILSLEEASMISVQTSRFLMILISLIFLFCTFWIGLLATPVYMLEVTRRYYTYKTGEEVRYPVDKDHRKLLPRALRLAIVTAGILLLAYGMTASFDMIFPAATATKVIAHRAGGNEAPENTIAGINAAVEAGAYGAEIDIQRTADGCYVVNHDNTFKRVAGVNKAPSQMTLEEIKKLNVSGEDVATFEEMLDACSGRLILFTELKGKTADEQMAEDAVRIIKEHGMEDEAVIISLKYNLIDYIETHYPEMQTGYLAFASFGNTAALNCDYLALEEELATSENIRSIHENGKKVIIWTINSRDSQKRFLNSNADAIITDEVSQAEKVIRNLEERTDLERIMDALLEWL